MGSINLLPETGSVVIIDDNLNEALPLMQSLSLEGIAFTYYSGKKDSIPKEAKQKIRIVFLDIQLVPLGDEHTYSQNILNILSQILGKNNGPYIAIIWSQKEKLYSQHLIQQLNLQQYPLRPVHILNLTKADYFKKKNKAELIAEIFDENKALLESRLEGNDINFVRDILQRRFKDIEEFEPKTKNVIKKIGEKLKKELVKADCFHYFSLWENTVHKASSKMVAELSQTFDYDEFWNNNMKHIICSLSQAWLGQNIVTSTKQEILDSSITILNQAFAESISSVYTNKLFAKKIDVSNKNEYCDFKFPHDNQIRICWEKFDRFKVYFNNEVAARHEKDKLIELKPRMSEEETINFYTSVNQYSQKSQKINTLLHFNLLPSRNIVPGNVYTKKNTAVQKKKILEQYLQKDFLNKYNEMKIKERKNFLNDFILIELEISPICDYAQRNQKELRYIMGLMFNIKNSISIKPGLNKIPSINLIEPEFLLNGKPIKLLFDYKSIKTIKVNEKLMKRYSPLFQIKGELLREITTSFANYISRPGVSLVK